MLPHDTVSARRQTLRPLPAATTQETLIGRAFPHLSKDIVRYVSRLEGMNGTDAKALLHPHSYTALEAEVLPRYTALKDFIPTAERIADAIMKGETIGISGDYDCDGNCSTALMVRLLQESNVPRGRIHVHIPNRKSEGYGINRDAVAAMDGKHVSLLIALDNGTLAHAPLADAKKRNMDAIVIDHHPNSAHHPLPEGALVVNPRRSDETLQDDAQGVGHLAAVGVTWMVARHVVALLEARGYYREQHIAPPAPRNWLGLVATATVGDVVSMRAPLNRSLVQEGLKVIREGADPFIAALAKVAQLPLATFNEESIAFRLAPIINAPGRLGQSIAWAFLSPADATSIATQSLVGGAEEQHSALHQDAIAQQRALRQGRFFDPNTENDRKLQDIAKSPALPAMAPESAQHALMLLSRSSNEMRKQIETAVTRQALPQARQWLASHPDAASLFLCGGGWHEGVIGIVAGRIKEEFNLPTFVASHDRDTGLCKCSARSIDIPGHPIDVGQAVRDLCEKDGLMLKAGGHPMAAGCSFEHSKLAAIRDAIEAKLAPAVQAAKPHQFQPIAVAYDMQQHGAKPMQAMQDWVTSQEALRPFGASFTKPRVGIMGGQVSHIRRSRDGRHLFFTLAMPIPLARSLAAPAAATSQTQIECQAFHACGSALETALRQCASAPKTHPLLLTGTLASADPANAREGKPSLVFQLEDTQFLSPHLRALLSTIQHETRPAIER